MPSLQTITSDDQVGTLVSTQLSFKVNPAESWTGTPIIQYNVQWVPEHECGAISTTFDSAEAKMGVVDGPPRGRGTTVLSLPELVNQKTKYHIRVQPIVVLSTGLTTGPFSNTFVLETKLGAVQKTISATNGDDYLCQNFNSLVNSTNVTGTCTILSGYPTCCFFGDIVSILTFSFVSTDVLLFFLFFFFSCLRQQEAVQREARARHLVELWQVQ